MQGAANQVNGADQILFHNSILERNEETILCPHSTHTQCTYAAVCHCYSKLMVASFHCVVALAYLDTCVIGRSSSKF